MTDKKKSFADRARDHATDDSPHAHQAPDRRRWTDFLKRRWPTGIAIATVIFSVVLSRVLGEEFEGYFLAWGILASGIVYLSWGARRGVLQRPGPQMLQTFGMVGFGSIALAALYVDPDLGRYVLAAGWFGHAAWDAAHHIAKSKVVARWWPELCGVVDFLVGCAILFT